GKMGGKALVSRTSDRRFLSALSSCQPDIVWPPAVKHHEIERVKESSPVSEALRPASLATMALVAGSLDVGIGHSNGCKECDMRGLAGPALAGAAVMVMLAPAAAQLSQNWAWCVNQGGTFSADQRIKGCSSVIQSGRETPRNLAVAYYSLGLAYYDKGD